MQSLIQIIDQINTGISSYTDDTTSEQRRRVVDLETGKKGIIVSQNVADPAGKNSAKGFVVQWMAVGGNTWYPSSELDRVNGKLKEVKPEFLDHFTTLYRGPHA